MKRIVLGGWLAFASLSLGAQTVDPTAGAAAARQTAQAAAACVRAQPFYWEIGDSRGVLGAGSAGRAAPRRDTLMHIASASKWVYAAYVAERRAGALSAQDIDYLTLRSGYTHFLACRSGQTVQGCLDAPLNGGGAFDAATAGRFSYGGGHMQRHAVLMGLGPLDAHELGQEVTRGLAVLGGDFHFDYSQPQPAGGGVTSAGAYARLLRGLLDGELRLAQQLGEHSVCASPATCPADAVRTPIPATESWRYSVGHWVEDPGPEGAGAFSSPGAFGFYPWISRDRQTYGLLAREDHQGVLLAPTQYKPALESVYCGRLIRAAFADGRPRQ